MIIAINSDIFFVNIIRALRNHVQYYDFDASFQLLALIIYKF